jgi:hypothetical protein
MVRSAAVMLSDALCSEMSFALFGGGPGASQTISPNNRPAKTGRRPGVAMRRRCNGPRVTER